MVLGVEVASVESSQVAIQAEASVQEHQFSREVGDRDMGRMHTGVGNRGVLVQLLPSGVRSKPHQPANSGVGAGTASTFHTACRMPNGPRDRVDGNPRVRFLPASMSSREDAAGTPRCRTRTTTS